jgi:hypothetical protein
VVVQVLTALQETMVLMEQVVNQVSLVQLDPMEQVAMMVLMEQVVFLAKAEVRERTVLQEMMVLMEHLV